MKILFLGYMDNPLINFIRDNGDEVITCADKIDLNLVHDFGADFIVSYGYRYIVKKDITQKYV